MSNGFTGNEMTGGEISTSTEDLPEQSQAKISTGKQVAKATATIMVFQGIKFAFGILEKSALSNFFSTTYVADAYSVARDFVDRIWLVFEKVINPSFLPCFIQALKEDGEERAWRFTNTVTALMTGILIVTTAVAWFIAPAVVNFYSRYPHPGEIQLTILLMRVMIFGLLFLGLSSLTYVILNGYKRFALAALGDTLWKGSILTAVVFVVPYLMKLHQGKTSIAVVALAGGYLVGGFMKLFPQLIGLWQKRHLFRISFFWNDPILRKMGVLIPPLLVGILVSEYRGMMMIKLANAPQIGEGSRAALKLYSRTPIDALMQIFPYAMSIGIFPYLSEQHISKDKQGFTDTFMGALRVCAYFFIPVTIAFIAFRYPILRTLYEGKSGKFTAHSLELTVHPFTWFSAGMVFFAAEMIVTQTWYSTSNTLIPNTVGIITSLTSVALAWLAVNSGHGLGGIALSETFAKASKVVILLLLMRGVMGNMRMRQQVLFLLKVFVSAAIMAAFGFVIFKLSHPIWGAVKHPAFFLRLERLACVAIALGGGLLVHCAASLVLKVEEANYVVGFLRKRMRSRSS